mgnify:CR=1 FL=1
MNLKEKAAFQRAAIKEKKEKASDLEVIVGEVMQLPYGQLKKVLTEPVLAILQKYGYGEAEA